MDEITVIKDDVGYNLQLPDVTDANIEVNI
jgi:hypothetical protein